MPINELLYCCKLRDESGNMLIGAEFLESAELDFSSFENKEDGTIFHTVYAESEPEGKANLAKLQKLVPLWNQYGAKITDLAYFEMKKEDWAEVWKKYFDIIHVTDRLVIKPSWLEFSPRPDQVVVKLDPGMSFGTGQHATTSFCLEVIDRLAHHEKVRSFMDAGCGSGILSIAARKLGYQNQIAFDNDPDCIMVSRENFGFNGIKEADIELLVADAMTYQPGREFDLVCANILGHLLKKFKHNITTWVRPQGYLCLAGILNEEFDALSAEFVALGYTELERKTLREWTGGLFQKN